MTTRFRGKLQGPSRTSLTASATTSLAHGVNGRYAIWRLSGPGAARRGRDGRGLSCDRHATRARGRGQGRFSASDGRSGALARFEREARTVAALSHPNIVALYDFGRDNGVVFAVMELLEGEPLERYLATQHLSWRRALEIAVAVADGLASAHGKGLVHRDLKPANIFITEEGLVKLLDFGLAKEDPFRSTSQTGGPTGAAETEPGAILGTVGYMSPEQVRGERADHRSDIFSLGCVLHEMLTGRRPFGGDTAAETLAAILRDQPAELATADGELPPRVDAVVRRCLEKNPITDSSRRGISRSRCVRFSTTHKPRRRAQERRRRERCSSLARSDDRLRSHRPRRCPLVLQRACAIAARAERGRASPLAGGPAAEESVARFRAGVLRRCDDGGTDDTAREIEQLARHLAHVRHGYRGTRKKIPEIARELNVDAILEGSVIRDGSPSEDHRAAH